MDIAKRIISRSFRLKAPAKVNLSLKITGRRGDGFHELSMLNAATLYCDDIDIKFLTSSDRQIEFTGETIKENLPTIESNLISKAINIVFGDEVGFHAKINKRIPIGGGLGGGSSNAGAILRLAQFLFPDLKKEIDLNSSKLGSDVPYFLSPSCFSVVEGIGEKLRSASVSTLTEYTLFLLFPNFSVLTPDAYRWFKESSSPFSTTLNISNWEEIIGQNDLEIPVTTHYPLLKKLLSDLRSFSSLSGMSGSGSTLFALSRGGELNESILLDWGARHDLRVEKTSFIETFSYPVEVTS